MRSPSLFLAATAGILMGVGQAFAREPDIVTYRCDEIVVIGRVKTLAFADVPNENDPIGHGVFDAQIAVKRVLRGKEVRRVVPASFYAHVEMRHDVDFWLVLRPVRDGRYSIRTGNLTRIPYKLAPTCSNDIED